MPIAKFAETASARGRHAVCGGDFVQLFQRQSFSYIFRRPDTGDVTLTQDQSADEALASVPPPILRGDLLWQLTPSTMAWSGGPLPLSDDDDRGLAFSIRHAITGMFLCEEEVSAAKKGTAAADDVECAVGLAAVDTQPSAQWLLRPFELDSVADGGVGAAAEPAAAMAVTLDRSQFWVLNRASGRALCRAEEAYHPDSSGGGPRAPASMCALLRCKDQMGVPSP
eukprot:COSAG01_NODE_562_length_15456_cov_24.731458_8_plen_225_part_00